jgi:diaminopimelate decarboxylase
MSAPFDFFRFEGGELRTESVRLAEIAEVTGTPVYVYSSEALLAPLREIGRGLEGLRHRVCFAVKSNSNVALLKLLAENGAGMDLVSGGELFRAYRAGVPADRIVFSGVGKTKAEMAQALERGIYSFNVESEAELDALDEVATGLKFRARVALRYNPDVDARTHPYISTGLRKNKFGVERREILAIARALRSRPGIDLRGISIHIGSQLLSLAPLDDAFKRLRALVDELDKILPEPLEFVDLGGGVGITYRNEKAPALSRYCALIRKHFGGAAGPGGRLTILIEPGRSIAGNAGALVTGVLYRKERGSKDFLVVDAAMNDLVRPALYGSYHEIVPVRKAAARAALRKTNVVGPVCESSDCFASDRKLPASLRPGDLLAILSAGAYGFTMSSNYNTRPRPPEVLVHGSEFSVIRTRETYEDLVRGERF